MSEKLTLCGCDECEEKMGKLLDWVNFVMNQYPSSPKTKCNNAKAIPSVPYSPYAGDLSIRIEGGDRDCHHEWEYEPKGFCSGDKVRTCKMCGDIEEAATPY